MKTIVQEIIYWMIKNATNIEDQAGNNWVAIDYEEMRTNFDKWLDDEKKQSVDFHIEVIKKGLIIEGLEKWNGSYEPMIKEIAAEIYDEIFSK